MVLEGCGKRYRWVKEGRRSIVCGGGGVTGGMIVMVGAVATERGVGGLAICVGGLGGGNVCVGLVGGAWVRRGGLSGMTVCK